MQECSVLRLGVSRIKCWTPENRPQENLVHTISTSQDAILETAARRDGQSGQLDEVVLSRALLSLAAGMEQIEHTLYNLMLRR